MVGLLIGVQSKYLTKCQMQNLFFKNNKSVIKIPKTIKWLTFEVDDKSKPYKENQLDLQYCGIGRRYLINLMCN